MNRTHYRVVGWALCVLLAACQPNPSEPDPAPGPDPTNPAGEVTGVGQPNGELVSKTIGPEGGTLTTPDGNVRLLLPAGALAKATVLSIQPITNPAPNGLGPAYRFLPEGTQFSKPATLTFGYVPAAASSHDPAAFGVAYQKADGIWYAVAGVQTDTARHQISVPMPHFSDWSPYELAQLDKFALNGGEEQGSILYYGESADFEVSALLEPLLPPGPGEAPLAYRSGGGVKWSVAGDARNGSVRANGYKATYQAPAHVPQQNPVTLSAELTFQNSPRKLILLREIFIGTGYFRLKFAGKEYQLTTGGLDDDDPNFMLISAGNRNAAIQITSTGGGEGTFPFGDIGEPGKSQIKLGIDPPGGKYTDYNTGQWFCNGTSYEAQGRVTITRYDDVRHAVTGTFSGNVIPVESQCTSAGPALSGEFYMTTHP